MLPRYFLLSFESVGLPVQKFKIDFQDGGHHAAIWDVPSECFKLFLIYKSAQYFLLSLESTDLSVQEKKFKKEL